MLSEEGQEFALLLVVLLDAAAEDVVVPAVDFDLVVDQGFGDAGLGAEIDELGDDVAADDGGEFGVFALFGAEGLAVSEGSFDVVQPATRLGEVLEALAVEGGLEGAAVGVAAEDDVLYLQGFYGVFDGGGDAVDFVAAYGDYIANAAGEEEVAGAGLEDEVGDDAGVRTGDEQPLGGLHLGEQVELGFLVREDVAVEAAVAFHEGFDMVNGFVGHSSLPWIA